MRPSVTARAHAPRGQRFLDSLLLGPEPLHPNVMQDAKLAWNTLLELYLQPGEEERTVTTEAANEGASLLLSSPIAARSRRCAARAARERAALELLQDPRAQTDLDHALMLVQLYDFKAGQLVLFTKFKMQHMVMQHYMETDNRDMVVETCKQSADLALWVLALQFLASRPDEPRQLATLLTNIDQADVLPPLQVVQILAKNPTMRLSVVKKYLQQRLQQQANLIDEVWHAPCMRRGGGAPAGLTRMRGASAASAGD